VPSLADYRQEAVAALDAFWFIQGVEELDRTDVTLSLRLHIRTGLFVQVFVGEASNSISFALIDGNTRIFGLDYFRRRWHLHPFGEVEAHVPYEAPLSPTPLFRFLVMVRDLLLEHEIL
jgi:hypothetical protein